jgi:hypothetical protein
MRSRSPALQHWRAPFGRLGSIGSFDGSVDPTTIFGASWWS